MPPYGATVLIAMSARAMVSLILKCAFIAGGEVAVAVWALAGWVVADMVAETPKHALLSPGYTHHRFFYYYQGQPVGLEQRKTILMDVLRGPA